MSGSLPWDADSSSCVRGASQGRHDSRQCAAEPEEARPFSLQIVAPSTLLFVSVVIMPFRICLLPLPHGLHLADAAERPPRKSKQG